MRLKHVWALLVALPLVGCDPPGETVDPDQEYTPSTVGTIGAIEFIYHCTSEWDVVCLDKLPFPERIAAGATFDISATGWDQGSLRVEIVGSAVAKEVPGGVQALIPGWFSYWAVAEVDGKVVDFRHLQVAEIGRLAVGILGDHEEWSEGPLFGYQGSTLDVAVRPMEVGPAGIGQALAGTLGAAWTLEGDTADLVSSGELPAAQVYLREPGTITITAKVGDLTGTTTIEVLASTAPDGGSTDGGVVDAGPTDAGATDAGTVDADAGATDGGATDTLTLGDAASGDASDAGSWDAALPDDGGPWDGMSGDAGDAIAPDAGDVLTPNDAQEDADAND